MVEKPPRDEDESQPNKRLDVRIEAAVHLRGEPVSEEKAPPSNYKETNTQIVRPRWRRASHSVFSILLSPSFWTAIATVSMAIFTFSLSRVSNRQWRIMKETLDWQIDEARARLVIDDLTVADFPSRPHIMFTLTNEGRTVAGEINVGVLQNPGTAKGNRLGPPPSEIIPGHPDPRGPSLGGGMSKTYNMEIIQIPGGPSFNDIFNSRGEFSFWFHVSVNYRDIRNEPHGITSCVFFEAYTKQFFPCFSASGDARDTAIASDEAKAKVSVPQPSPAQQH
jgi:hypothetical protein